MDAKLNRVSGIILFLILCTPIAVALEERFQVGFKENAELTYEYSHVDVLLLSELASEELSYADFLFIPVGTMVKWRVVQLQETSQWWNLLIEMWSGSGFRELANTFQTRMFKNPAEFSYDFFNGTASYIYFLPVNVSNYLISFNITIPSSERSFSSVNQSQIVYDWTSSSRNDTIIYSYNRFGMLEALEVQYNHTTAFRFQLIQYTLGFDSVLLWGIVGGSIGGSVGIALGGFWYWRKNSKTRKRRKKNLKILKKLR